MPFFPGKSGNVSVNGTLQPLTDWSVDGKTDPIDVTNFLSLGAQENEAGISSLDISASGPYDGGASAQPGALVQFVLSCGPAGPNFTVTARVQSIKIDQNVKDVAKISYSAASTGPFSVSF